MLLGVKLRDLWCSWLILDEIQTKYHWQSFAPFVYKIIGLIIETELSLRKNIKAEFCQYAGAYWLWSSPSCVWWVLRKVPHFFMDPFLGAAPKMRVSHSWNMFNEFKLRWFVIIDSWEVVWSPALRWLPGRLYAGWRACWEQHSGLPMNVFASFVRCMNQVKAVIPAEEELRKNGWSFFLQ